MKLQTAVHSVFVQLTSSVDRLTGEEYVRPCPMLSSNTIGQHVRHIIELFQCLEEGYRTGTVNYENRKRDRQIELNKELALSLLAGISRDLDRPNCDLLLKATYDDTSSETIEIHTNYYREIAYNLEHTIHHMALMRIGIGEVSDITLSEDFGVASSTVKHRRQCAQ